jgi:hypothetical protein
LIVDFKRRVAHSIEEILMARKRTLNYRDFRGDFDESGEGRKKEDEDEVEGEEEEDEEEEESDEEEDESDEEKPAGDDEEGEEEEEAPKKPPKPAKKPAKAPRAKKRPGKVVRMKVIWVVYNNSNQKVASYDYKQETEAREHAEKLKAEKKQTFFVQPVKEPIEEKPEKAEKG